MKKRMRFPVGRTWMSTSQGIQPPRGEQCEVWQTLTRFGAPRVVFFHWYVDKKTICGGQIQFPNGGQGKFRCARCKKLFQVESV